MRRSRCKDPQTQAIGSHRGLPKLNLDYCSSRAAPLRLWSPFVPIQNRPGHGRTRRCEGCNPVKVTSPFPKGQFVSPVILPGGAGDPPLPALTGAYSFSSELVESHPWLFRHLVLRSAILLLLQNCRGIPGLISTGISSSASAIASKIRLGATARPAG